MRMPVCPSSSCMNAGCMQMSVDSLSLRKVRAIATALSAWLHDCGPTTCNVGQSTHARACAATCSAGAREMGYSDAASVLGSVRCCGGVAVAVAWRWEGKGRRLVRGGRRHLHRDVARPRRGPHLGQVVPSVRR